MVSSDQHLPTARAGASPCGAGNRRQSGAGICRAIMGNNPVRKAEGLPMLRPVRTARVTTKRELDAALATADQVTIEGDDDLLSYAMNKAAGNPENQVAIEFEDRHPAAVGEVPWPLIKATVTIAL